MNKDNTKAYWLLGAVIDGVDQVDRFVREGIWEHGYADRYIDKIKSVQVGDRVAIKASYTRSKNLPFDNHGNIVSCISIKAVGTVTGNPGDGRRLLVDWTKLAEPKEWYFYTQIRTVWEVHPGNWASDALIRFVFEDQPQDLERFINHPFWFDRYGDRDSVSVYRYDWARFYATVADNLLAYRKDRSALVAWMHQMASEVDGVFHLTDKDASGNVVPLSDIDPFSAMGTFNRSLTSEKRRIIASRFKEFLDVGEVVPGSFSGIPILDNRNSLFIKSEKDRGPDDIEILWDVFYEAIRLADGGDDYDSSAFVEAYDKAAALPGVGWNLTMGLYWIRPWAFIPLDTNTREYIKNVLGIEVETSGPKGRCTGSEYLSVNDAVLEKLLEEDSPVHSIPVLSTIAGGWESSISVADTVAARLEEFKTLVLRSFPSLSDVSDPLFQSEEVEYKREASALVRSLIPESVFSSMMEAGEYSELIALLRSAGSKTNLLYLGTPAQGDLAPLCNDYSDEEALCRAFYDLIWGSGESWERLDSFYSFVSSAGLPVRWPTATYYLFLVHPSTEMFVKPGVMKWLLEFFSMPMLYESNPTGQLYREILELCEELKSQLSSWGVTDMIELNSLIWAAYKAPDKDSIVAEPEEVYEMNPDSLFTSRTFELLSMLHKDPTKEFYAAYADEFKEYLREPMKRLFAEIASGMPPEFSEHLETSRKLFSRIPKNDWGQGGAWDFYWGAFYPKGEKRITASQLFMLIDRHGVRYGFSHGQYAENSRIWLRDFLKSSSPAVKILGDSLSRIPSLVFSAPSASVNGTPLEPGSGYRTFDEFVKHIDTAELDLSAHLSSDEILSLSSSELVEKVSIAFKALFPLMSTSQEALASLFSFEDDDEEEEALPLNPPLSLDDIHSSTGYDHAWIERAVAALRDKKQCVLYGPPGTGKTFLAKKIASHLIGGGFGFCDVVQFHPSYSYEDFIEGLRPVASSTGLLEYILVEGRFKEFCDRARKLSEPCVLIVDEINRANLSRVFGELMYLLEYREEEITLAGSKEKFSIPSNVFIIGTMNTADRSIALVDHALRRRFAFVHMKPDYDVLSHYHSDTGFSVDGLRKVLEKINKDIGDRNYFIGVSFFLKKDITSSISNVWQLEILPYLEEYFFDRPEIAEKYSWKNVAKEITGME